MVYGGGAYIDGITGRRTHRGGGMEISGTDPKRGM